MYCRLGKGKVHRVSAEITFAALFKCQRRSLPLVNGPVKRVEFSIFRGQRGNRFKTICTKKVGEKQALWTSEPSLFKVAWNREFLSTRTTGSTGVPLPLPLFHLSLHAISSSALQPPGDASLSSGPVPLLISVRSVGTCCHGAVAGSQGCTQPEANLHKNI